MRRKAKVAKTKKRVYRMTLAEFHRYLQDKRKELQACYKEIEEVQFQLNEMFNHELEVWQEQLSFCYPRLAKQRDEMHPPFAEQIDAVEDEERERIRQEIADLGQEIEETRRRMDELMAQGQAATKALREQNPKLNEREEHLKKLISDYEEEYAQAYEEIEALRRPPLGGLTHLPKILRLRRVQKRAKEQQRQAIEEMREVRQTWKQRIEETGETQAELRKEWEGLGTKLSQARGRRDHLQANFDALAQQAALQRVLEELEEPPDVSGELGEGLEKLAKHNKIRQAYETGLRSVAEALGLLKALGEGLDRFGNSVRTVRQEQRRFDLPRTHVMVPHSVAITNQIWKTLQQQVEDEKYMGTHPLKFSRIVDRYIKSRLADEQIESFFQELGQALNRATEAWN
jgi:predicted  nucleic acid-binding Zn-ribbon protein